MARKHSENFTAFSRAVSVLVCLAVLVCAAVVVLLLVSAAAAVLVPLLLGVPPQPAAITATMTAMPKVARGQSVLVKGFLLVCCLDRQRFSAGLAHEAKLLAPGVVAVIPARLDCR